MNVVSSRDFGLVGRGLYSVGEASKIARVPPDTLRRWVFGYVRKRQGERVEYPPLIAPEIEPFDQHCVVGFRDLLEVRVVHAFRTAGVSWRVIRLAAKNAQTPERPDHPFLSKRFRTDGRSIFIESIKEAGDAELLDLARNQHAFHSVVAPSLFKQIVFGANDEPLRWYPMWPQRTVFIDPNRCFGRPLAGDVPAETLAAAAQAESSLQTVARWFRVPVEAVSAAVEWQEQLAA